MGGLFIYRGLGRVAVRQGKEYAQDGIMKPRSKPDKGTEQGGSGRVETRSSENGN